MLSETRSLPKYVLPGILFSDVARGTGLSLACVSRVMNGSREGKIGTLEKIASYLTGAAGVTYTVDSLRALVREKPWLLN